MAETETVTNPTLVYDDRATAVGQGRQAGDDLWLKLPDVQVATGWQLKPEGVCRGDICVPLAEDQSVQLLRREREDTWFNLTAFAHIIEQPAAHDPKHNVWAFGPPGMEWRAGSRSGEAPDFTLPDLDGNPHALSDVRGKKVVLTLWASW